MNDPTSIDQDQAEAATSTNNILNSIRAMKHEAASRAKANRSSLLKALIDLKATHAVVFYSGSGDSGSIESVDIYRGEERIDPVDLVTILTGSSQWNSAKGHWEKKLDPKSLPLNEALQEFVYDWLEAEHSGWENNDGASGECKINVLEDRFVLEHTNYYTESDYSESVL